MSTSQSEQARSFRRVGGQHEPSAPLNRIADPSVANPSSSTGEEISESNGDGVASSDQAQLARAAAYVKQGHIEEARELYLRLALSRRLSTELMLQAAAGLASVDAPQLAMRVCEWVTEKDDRVAQAYFDMGIYSANSGNELYLTEALIRRAVQLDPESVEYRIGLVSLLVQLHRDDEAIGAFGDTSESQIQLVKCHTCLERTESLLNRHSRNNLAVVCRARIAELRASPDAATPQTTEVRSP